MMTVLVLGDQLTHRDGPLARRPDGQAAIRERAEELRTRAAGSDL
jgi:hypothetical protein